MNQIILDSYYLVKLHQDNGECISIRRLTDMLYVYEAAFMNVHEVNSIYDEDFMVGTNGIYVKAINEEFKEFEECESIMIEDKRLEALAKEVSKQKKNDIGFIYRYFRNISDSKVHEFIMSEDSPIDEVYQNPELTYYNMLHNIGIAKARMKTWYYDFVMKF